MISGENAYILNMLMKIKFSYVRILDRTSICFNLRMKPSMKMRTLIRELIH